MQQCVAYPLIVYYNAAMQVKAIPPLFILIIWPHCALSGAWTRPVGDGLLVTNAVYFTSDAFFDLQGNRQPQERFDKYEINPYVEYGWRDGITVGANVFLDYVTQNAIGAGQNDNNIGLADTELFLRKRLYEKDGIAIAVRPLIKLPSLFRQSSTPKSGDDELAAELSLFGGYSFNWNDRDHYIETRVGYRHRFNNLRDQYLLEARLGYRYNEELLIIPAAYATISTDLPGSAIFSENGENEFDLYKLELGSVYQINDIYSFHSSGFYHIDGKQTGSGVGVSAGFGVKF